MSTVINNIRKKTRRLINISSKIIFNKKIFNEGSSSLQALRVVPWFRDNGDKTLRLNYELNEKSVVIDLGGYEGQWAADIFCKYVCSIHVFEPVKKFADNIEERFKKNSKVMIYAYGLSKANIKEKLSISADSSSTFKPGQETEEIQLVKIDDFLVKNNIEHVDLMKINIEGGEYDLLEHLTHSDRISIFENIQVQFHDFVPMAKERMYAIQNNLSKTHYLTYQYEFVWENWKLKNT
jgi:FkbM family methyltransferase